jgi:hypothetical protein
MTLEDQAQRSSPMAGGISEEVLAEERASGIASANRRSKSA